MLEQYAKMCINAKGLTSFGKCLEEEGKEKYK